jgi:para-nitrobenzyl esterase
MSRVHRRLLAGVGAAAVVFGLLWGGPGDATATGSPDTAGPVVRTDSGLVRGTEGDGTREFLGIPYAAPPVGPLRWRDPRPPAPWSGVRDATRPGPACEQHPVEVPEGSTSEDCLYLNVTAPTAPAAGPRPVVVWLHGGGFLMGAGHNYDATRWSTQGDVVVVTVNYRLGVLGFFGHPGLEGSGTFGLRDQQAALAWVRRNAAAFGGDPGNVTLAGQSAGAISACAQLTSPSAAGLFDKVVLQSGSCDLGWLASFEYRGQPADAIYEPLASVRAQGRRTATELGCDRPARPAATLACLRELPTDALLPVLEKYIQPAHGTDVLPQDPVDALRAGRFHRVPVLAGSTSDEGTLATSLYDDGRPMTQRTYRAVMAETFGPDESRVRAVYPRSAYDSAALAWAAITTDRKWACSQLATTRRLARHVPVHAYEYADPQAPPLSPLPPSMPMGAYHSSDLWSLFDLVGRAPALDPDQQRLSEQMIAYWSSFAATGRPAKQADGPRWPAFERDGRLPYVQSLAPGDTGIGPVELAAEHHCGFWRRLAR